MKISVIIPVYNALEDVKLCLESLKKNFNFKLGNIIVINDYSDINTKKYLNKFAIKNPNFKIIHNSENLGFIKTCNKGMKLADGEILVLLNSDTKIPKEFCERIIKCFNSNEKIGIASPISSQTFTYFVNMPKRFSLEQMNKRLRKKHKCTYPIIPAAEGFCFCIRKNVITQQGYLDEIYGKGYHEEVDFAYRSLTNGWINVLIDDLYVFHKRQASFGTEKREELIRKNNPVFKARWDGFREKYEMDNNLKNPIFQIRTELNLSYNNNSFIEDIFSVKNDRDRKHKKVTILGIKLKLNLRSFRKIFSVYNVKSPDDTSHKVFCILGFKLSFRRNNENNKYKIYCESFGNNFNDDFVDYKNNNNINSNIKLIAYYLPQYHPFQENDEWHGKGFTEWTNVAKAKPLYESHYQPHIPYDVGFYNLNNNEIFYRQIELARNYGIYGFCFYYYWFSGRKLMEKPIYNYLKEKSLNFPFCLCWACENWSKLWDGGNKEVLINSELRYDDFENFWNDILPFLKDERYIKIHGKPLIQLYRPLIFDSNILKSFIKYLRKKSIECGFNGLYLMLVITSDIVGKCEENMLKEYDIDAFSEFPPHGLYSLPTKKTCYLNNNFHGTIRDFTHFINKDMFKNTNANIKNLYKGCFPMWDNSPRKANSGCIIYHGANPDTYYQWLSNCIHWTINNHIKEEQIIFINAWNEWAEGAHLEPDLRYGYAYLQATCNALRSVNEK